MGTCHTARQVRGGAGAGASHVLAAESVRPVPGPVHPPAGGRKKTMKTETNKKTGRESTTCTLKPHRLICINPPGNVRTKKRSARAAGQKDEQPGSAGPGPVPPATSGRAVPQGTAGDETGRAARPGPALVAKAGEPVPPGTEGDGTGSSGRQVPESGGGGLR